MITSGPSQLRLRKKDNLNKNGQDSFGSYFALLQYFFQVQTF